MHHNSRRQFLQRTAATTAVAGTTALAGCGEVISDILVNLGEAIDPDWGQYQYDSGHTGHNPDGTGPSGNVTELWSSLQATPMSSPVVDQGKVFVTLGNDLFAFDAKFGEKLWSANVGNVRETPVVMMETVYTGAGTAHPDVVGLNAETGEVKWEHDPGLAGKIFGPLMLSDFELYVPFGGEKLAKFDVQDNEFVTSYDVGNDPGADSYEFGAVADGYFYYYNNETAKGDDFYNEPFGGEVLDPSKGDSWTAKNQSSSFMGGVPTVRDSRMFVRMNDGGIGALSTEDHSFDWVLEVPIGDSDPDNFPTFAADEDTVYVPNTDPAQLWALHSSDGSKKWVFDEFSRELRAPPVVVDGVVYIGDESGQFYALDKENGEEIWSLDLTYGPRGPAAVVDGIVYVATFDGAIRALGNEASLDDSDGGGGNRGGDGNGGQNDDSDRRQ